MDKPLLGGKDKHLGFTPTSRMKRWFDQRAMTYGSLPTSFFAVFNRGLSFSRKGAVISCLAI
jgi:hypothetical protein